MTLSHDTHILHYEYLQEHQNYGTHPTDAARAQEIACWVLSTLPPGARVLDCSCGRGLLLTMLRHHGYEVDGTEASRWEIENVLKPLGLPVRRLFYSELPTLPSANWDAVVSDDVLEHLFTEDEVRAALRELARMSRKVLCVTVGLNYAERVLDNARVVLHHVVRDPAWWVAEVARVASVQKHYQFRNSYVIFAEVHACKPSQ